MKVKEESEKAGLKLNIQKTKIVAYSSVTSCQIDEETMEKETLFSWAPKITADGDYSHETKSSCSFGSFSSWKKSYGQPRQHIKNITLPTKICTVRAIVFPVVMYGCESWSS